MKCAGKKKITKLWQLRHLSDFFTKITEIPEGGLEIRWGPPKRSNKQNRYLFGVVYKTLALGMTEQNNAIITVDMVHELCKQYFAPRVGVPGTGKDIPMSTTQLCRSGDTETFQDYVTQIQALGAAKGIYIPDPNEEFHNDC